MANTKKRALTTSAVAVLLCIVMLIGATFAWFTDSESTGMNKIQAGTLDIELWTAEYTSTTRDFVEGTEKNISDSKDPIFNHNNMEPGYLAFANLDIRNVGTLAAQLKATIVPVGEAGPLAEVIEVYVKADIPFLTGTARDSVAGNITTPPLTGNPAIDAFAPVDNDINAIRVGTLAEVIKGEVDLFGFAYGEDHITYANDGDILGIALLMPEEVGNTYQGAAAGAFDIRIDAKQAVYESDSIDNTYDANATYAWDGKADHEGLEAGTDKDDKTVTISTAGELKAFEEAVNGGNSYAGYTVTLANDIDLCGNAWTPIGQTGATEFKGVFDGNNKTISNLTINNADESKFCSTGLFGWIESHGSEGVTVKNLTIDGATVTGHHYVGAVVGYVYGTIENCHVKNATIRCTSVNDDANGDKCGAIAGYVGEDAKISNCTAADSAISAGRDAGQVVGAAKAACVTGCSATNVTVTANGTSSGNNINEAVIGRVL